MKNMTVDASGKTFDCIGDFGAADRRPTRPTITATMTVDAGAPPPTQLSATVTADPGNAIAESDETNNTKTETTTVSGTVCGGPPCVDLVRHVVDRPADPVTLAGGLGTWSTS